MEDDEIDQGQTKQYQTKKNSATHQYQTRHHKTSQYNTEKYVSEHQKQTIPSEQSTIINSKSCLEEPNTLFSSSIILQKQKLIADSDSLVGETTVKHCTDAQSTHNHSSELFDKQNTSSNLHVTPFQETLNIVRNRNSIQKSQSNVSSYVRCLQNIILKCYDVPTQNILNLNNFCFEILNRFFKNN